MVRAIIIVFAILIVDGFTFADDDVLPTGVHTWPFNQRDYYFSCKLPMLYNEYSNDIDGLCVPIDECFIPDDLKNDQKKYDEWMVVGKCGVLEKTTERKYCCGHKKGSNTDILIGEPDSNGAFLILNQQRGINRMLMSAEDYERLMKKVTECNSMNQ